MLIHLVLDEECLRVMKETERRCARDKQIDKVATRPAAGSHCFQTAGSGPKGCDEASMRL
jgi:hypothetical protein